MSLIGLDYTAAIHQSAGIGRYARELTAALGLAYASAEETQADPLRLFVAAARRADLPPPPIGCEWRPSALSERNHARLWHRLRLPLPVEYWTGPLDLFHATDFTLPPTRLRAQTVLTVHDLAFERFPDETMPGMLGFLKSAVPRSARRADAIIAVSEATRRDLIESYSLPPEKVTVVPHGVSSRFSPPTDGTRSETRALQARYHLPDAPFILTVGTLQPRKNHKRLVQALSMMTHRVSLVIAGGTGWAYDAAWAEVSRLRLEDRVVFAGFADDADLPALYRAAAVCAYPALYEGFGLPVLEAMASGVPVVTSNTSSLPEAAGDAALLVDPLEPAAIADALDRVLADGALRAELVRKGLERAAQFTWAKAAGETRRLYDSLLVGGDHSPH